MGSSDSGGTNGLLDCSIGTIVWVRRRNGSWWPGKILGVEELSASHLMSPRSGTPVKLLGREDASVDWYNLEKSKRVKPFRCGEFDECIERAEASLGLPSKKREKYARREDAILHALELEKEILEKKYGKGGAKPFINNATCVSSGKDLRSPSIALRNGNVKHEVIEDECNSNILPAQKVEGVAWQNSFNSQCFTLPKKIGSFALSPSHEATNDDQAEAVSAGCIDSGNSSDKGKGLIDGSIEESSIRRRDRRRPLYQVMQDNAELARDDDQVKKRRLLYLQSQPTDMVDAEGDSFSQMDNLSSHRGVGNYYHADTFEKDASSGSSEDTESDSSETDSMEHYSHVDTTTYSDVYTPMTLQSRALNSMQEDQPSTSSSESDESSHQDSPHFHRKDPISLNTEMSKWQLKGKRNTRSFSRRSSDKFSYGAYLDPRPLNQQNSHNLSYYHDHDNYINEVDFMEDDLNQYTWKPHVFGGFNSHYDGLFDVDLKVQARYQRRVHLPFVSLMSKLDGKPIIGHPIQVETLLDGSTDDLVSFGDFESDDGNRAPPSWTTARRTTSFRVPRPHISSHLDDFDYQQDQRSTNSKKKNSARALRKKPLKRSSSTSSQKIRPLSSIGMDQNHTTEPRQHSRLISYMKPLDSGPPIVACIPVKLVFSRLLEAIGRPPSSNKGLG